MQFSLRDFLLGVAATAVLGAIGARHLNSKIARFETAVAVADSARKLVEQDSERLLTTVVRQRASIDSLLAANATARGLLQSATRTITVLRGSLAELDAAVQQDSACWRLCRPALAARDTIITLTSAQRDSAFLGWQRSDSSLASAGNTLAAAESVVAAQDTVIRAYKRAVDLAPTYSTFWSHLKPDVGVGAWAGYDVRVADFGYGFGLTFDWSIW